MPLSIHSLLFEKRPNFYVPISFKLLILVSSRRYDAKKNLYESYTTHVVQSLNKYARMECMAPKIDKRSTHVMIVFKKHMNETLTETGNA